jgi:thioredoxin-dependent peroxiredoxin
MKLEEGKKAPAFSAESDDVGKVSLKDLKGKKVVLYFYPKDMTSGCTQQACDFRDMYAQFKKKGIQVIGVSKDSLESHGKFRAKYKLPFPLLADEDQALCKAFGVWQEKSLYGRKFMGIVRTTVVINEKGEIEKIYPKVKVNGHVKEVLAFCNNSKRD